MTKEALKKALEAFGEIEWSNNSQWQSDRAKVAITAIKEALAQPEQEPVGQFVNIEDAIVARRNAVNITFTHNVKTI